jgi:hypothetical protein
MPKRLGDIVSERAHANFTGRKRELDALGELLADDGPLVFHVHGVAGIGKSSLLEAFAARALRARVVRIDCRAVEPTARGFLAELSEALGSRLSTVEDAARRLASFRGTVVLALDTYEVFRLLDSWMRQVFVASSWAKRDQSPKNTMSAATAAGSVLSFVMVVSFPASYSREGTKTSVSKSVSTSILCFRQLETDLLKSQAKQKMLDTIITIDLRIASTVSCYAEEELKNYSRVILSVSSQ